VGYNYVYLLIAGEKASFRVIARSEATWRYLFYSLYASFEIASLGSQLSPAELATINENLSLSSL